MRYNFSMGVRRTSVRYFLGKPVRAIWSEEKETWFFSAVDIVRILSCSNSPRKYWNTLKKRHPEIGLCSVGHYLYSGDGKRYRSDTLDAQGVSSLSLLIPTKRRAELILWLQGSLDPLDEQSKRRAYELYDGKLIDLELVGTFSCLQQIHSFLFSGLYDFAGKVRTKTISKGGFVFGNGDFLPSTLKSIDSMPDGTFDEIISKYIEMNIAHPFMEGNGRSTRIWLDMLCKERLKKCVDWSLVDKKEYLKAMEESPYNPKPIHDLLFAALSDQIDSREIFMKGIDCSYYYEEVE